MDNYVENVVDNSQNHLCLVRYRDIHRIIHVFLERFPQFFAEKKYKLIKFAPKLEIVDKWSYELIIREKESTVGIENLNF